MGMELCLRFRDREHPGDGMGVVDGAGIGQETGMGIRRDWSLGGDGKMAVGGRELRTG